MRPIEADEEISYDYEQDPEYFEEEPEEDTAASS